MANFPSKSYARNLLEKYGWNEGKGLGKSESGMVEALKPKLKFDKTGIGHDHAEQFTFNWWEVAFNEAAKRVSIDVTNGKSVRQLESADHCISNKRPSIDKLIKGNPLKYGKFIKTETLTSGGTLVPVPGKVTSHDVDECTNNPLLNLTDDELLKICGGRTAHKAARHGHKLVGKLARVIEQEKEHLSTSGSSFKEEMEADLVPAVNVKGDGGRRNGKKKKRNNCSLVVGEDEQNANMPCTPDDGAAETGASIMINDNASEVALENKEVKKKKKKKKRKGRKSDKVRGCELSVGLAAE